jgi:hypothetical protein
MALWEWCQKHHRHLTRGQVRTYVNEALAYHAATDNKKGYTKWVAVCRLWITRGEQFANRRMAARAESRVPLFEGDNVIDLAARRKA